MVVNHCSDVVTDIVGFYFMCDPFWDVISLFLNSVTKQRDPETGQQSLLFQVWDPVFLNSILIVDKNVNKFACNSKTRKM